MTDRILCVDGDVAVREATAETFRSELTDLDLGVETAGTVPDAEVKSVSIQSDLTGVGM
ncbi:hypothetical protein [Halorhabdus rudnickae]|uniref:hypothetical protein n=1 Tax=Halorhabdus rudnickae TaxID=1775544 RepID=UPI001AEFB5A6|nr:hypothetical protein [Halorhabdus rudnickae]